MRNITLILLLAVCCHAANAYEAPSWADPNMIIGEALPWTSGDPNGWEAPTGKGIRAGTWTDPDNHMIDVNVPTGWSVEVTPTGDWTLAGDIEVGANYIVVTATDKPGPEYDGPKSATYTVLAWGLPKVNHAPILAGTFEAGRMAMMRWKQRLIQKRYKQTGELLKGSAANAYVATMTR